MGKGPAEGGASEAATPQEKLGGCPRTRVLIPPISPGCHAAVPPTSALGLLVCRSCSWALTPTLS